MKKFFILAIFVLFAFTAFSQETDSTKKSMKEYTVQYEEVTDTLNTIAIVFENDYMKRTSVMVVIKTTTPVRLYEEKTFLTTVGTPIRKENIFMFLVKSGQGVQWVSP